MYIIYVYNIHVSLMPTAGAVYNGVVTVERSCEPN